MSVQLSGVLSNQETGVIMSIYKAKVESNFAIISNKTLRDSSLSYEATGLLAMMLSLPDDWEIHKSWLQTQKIKCGRDKLTSMMNELINAGYVVKKVKQEEGGRLNGVDWFVYAEPQNNRITENPSDGKTTTTKKDSLKRKDPKPKQLSHESRYFIDQLGSEFEYCQSAMSELRRWDSEGVSNIYLGSLKIEQWQECESKLREVCIDAYEAKALIFDIYETYKCQRKKSISLPYLCFEGKDVEDFKRIMNL